MHIDIWGDGASCGNSMGPGGWCALIKIDNHVHHTVHGGDPTTTNNVMEMQAIISGLESVITMLGLMREDSGNIITVISDSNYIIGAFNDGWVIKWLINGWRKSLNGTLLRPNAEVWQKLVALVSDVENNGNEIIWRHVRGHKGVPENEYCDKIAKSEKQRQKRIIVDTKLCMEMR